jgi:U3 small nucleolar RNA-associated protein 13
LNTYEIGKKVKKVGSKCLYLDEVIDIKVFKPLNQYALMCSNSETLKLLCIATGEVEMYPGHSDLILCVDISNVNQMCLTGAKDNTVMLWRYDLDAKFERKL